MILWLDVEVFECGGWILERVLKKLGEVENRRERRGFERRGECVFEKKF
jgi:hypothetical protein